MKADWLLAASLKPSEVASIVWSAVRLAEASWDLLETAEQLMLGYKVPPALSEVIQCAYTFAQAGFVAPGLFAHLSRRVTTADLKA